ncbi:MAG: hypothetical protein JJ863_27805 [Deltaproteobacteria bacterium]|nr:hypothetical protein [Deltaproteobacteria bacterium]
MKRTKWLVPALAAAMLAGAGLWGSSAEATVMVELTLEDMARDAVAIVHGRVVRTGGHLGIRDGSAEPFTVTTLDVIEWIKGPGGDRIELREIGGELGGNRGGMAIDGVPNYDVGEEVVVFLENDPHGDFYRTYGMVQGKFVVLHGVPGVPDTVVRDSEAVTFARWTEGRMVLQRGTQEAMALETFLDAVAGALRFAPPRIDTPDVTGEVSR